MFRRVGRHGQNEERERAFVLCSWLELRYRLQRVTQNESESDAGPFTHLSLDPLTRKDFTFILIMVC